MKISRPSINFIVSILLLTIGCTSVTPEVTIQIPSLREYYPILLKEAQNWHADAYLHDARIFLFPWSPDSYHISASFYSPSEDSESFAVDLLQDGTITSEIFIHDYPVYHHKPITENDWEIDSQEAMESMLDQAGRQSINPDKNAGSFIILERVLPAEDHRVVWFLSLWDGSDAVQRLYLDANSGEFLDSSAINIKPTRIPTRIP